MLGGEGPGCPQDPRLHHGPTRSPRDASRLAAPCSVSPPWPCQASSNPFSLPGRSDLWEAANKQSFHCFVKDGPILCHSSLIFRKNKNVLFQTLHLASWNDASDQGRQGWQKNELLHKDGVFVHFYSLRERCRHSTNWLLDTAVSVIFKTLLDFQHIDMTKLCFWIKCQPTWFLKMVQMTVYAKMLCLQWVRNHFVVDKDVLKQGFAQNQQQNHDLCSLFLEVVNFYLKIVHE